MDDQGKCTSVSSEALKEMKEDVTEPDTECEPDKELDALLNSMCF